MKDVTHSRYSLNLSCSTICQCYNWIIRINLYYGHSSICILYCLQNSLSILKSKIKKKVDKLKECFCYYNFNARVLTYVQSLSTSTCFYTHTTKIKIHFARDCKYLRIWALIYYHREYINKYWEIFIIIIYLAKHQIGEC